MDEYEAQLSPQEQEVLAIARDHLGDSYDMERSLGYKAWLETQPQAKQPQAKQPQQGQAKPRLVRRGIKRKLRVRRRRTDAGSAPPHPTAESGGSTSVGADANA